MATRVDIAETNSISASQMSEFFRLAAIPGSHVNRNSFQTYLENRVIGSFPEGTVVRHAKVNRTRTPQEVVDAVVATSRTPYVDTGVLATMPQGEGDEKDVYFVPTKCFVPAKAVPALLAQYGLVSDPRAQAAVNEDDPTFADKYPNASQWGDNCYLAFYRWYDGERFVNCHRDDYDWYDSWFLSGVLASAK